jgi:hypothetical protein
VGRLIGPLTMMLAPGLTAGHVRPLDLRRTLTWDQGKEMAEHVRFIGMRDEIDIAHHLSELGQGDTAAVDRACPRTQNACHIQTGETAEAGVPLAGTEPHDGHGRGYPCRMKVYSSFYWSVSSRDG